MALCYPKNKQEHYGAYVIFQPLEITPPTIDTEGSLEILKTVKDLALKAFDTIGGGNDDGKVNIENIGNNQVLLTKNFANSKKTKILWKEAVKIYLPTAFTTTDTLTYDSPQLGISGGILENSMNNAAGSFSEIGSAALTAALDTFRTNQSADLANLAASRLANRFGSRFGLDNAVNSALRVTVDPNIRTLFKGVGIRSFQFQFKFIAESQEEAIEVEKIIKRFRKYAYPESISSLGANIGFKFPNPFKITVKYRENAPIVQDPKRPLFDNSGNPILNAETEKEDDVQEGDNFGDKQYATVDNVDGQQIGPKLKDCYLTNITTNYNPTSMSFHSDGRPVEIDLSLSFTEQTTLNRNDIENSDNPDIGAVSYTHLTLTTKA